MNRYTLLLYLSKFNLLMHILIDFHYCYWNRESTILKIILLQYQLPRMIHGLMEDLKCVHCH